MSEEQYNEKIKELVKMRDNYYQDILNEVYDPVMAYHLAARWFADEVERLQDPE